MSYNNFKSTYIRGGFSNLDYPDGSVNASALFQRDVSISGTTYGNSIKATDINGLSLGVGKTSGLSNNISLGGGLSANNTGSQNISIGFNSHFACGNPQRNTAIGLYTMANSNDAYRCVAIGYGATSLNNYGTSIGYNAQCGISGLNGVAIGANSNALYSNSIAIGYGVTTTDISQIMLGNSTQYVNIPNILMLSTIPNVFNYLTSLSGNFTNYLTTTLASSTYQTQTSATSNFNTLSSLIYSYDTIYFNYFNSLSGNIYSNYNTLSSLVYSNNTTYFNYFNSLSGNIYSNYNTLSSLVYSNNTTYFNYFNSLSASIYSISGVANNQAYFNTLSSLIYSNDTTYFNYFNTLSSNINTNYNTLSALIYSVSGYAYSISGNLNNYITSSSGLINSISGYAYSISGNLNNYITSSSGLINSISGNLYKLVYNNIDNSSATNYCLLFAPQLTGVQNNSVYQTGTAGTNILYYTPSTNTINATCSLATSSTNSQNTLNVNIVAAPNSSTASQSILFINNTSGSGTGNFPCHTTNILQYVSSTGNLSSTTFTGALVGNASTASQVNINSSNTNSTFYIPFVSASGNQTLYIDDTTTPSLKYNPNGPQLSCDNIVGANIIMTGNITANTGLISQGTITASGTITSSGLITANGGLTVNKPITLQSGSSLIALTTGQLGYSTTVGNTGTTGTGFVIGGASPNNYALLKTIIGTVYPVGVYLITGSIAIQGYGSDTAYLYYVGLSLSQVALNDGFGNSPTVLFNPAITPYYIPIKSMAIGASNNVDFLFFSYVHTVSANAGASGLYVVINGPTYTTNTRYHIINYQITRLA